MNIRTSRLALLAIIFISCVALRFWWLDPPSLLPNRALDQPATPTAHLLAWPVPLSRQGNPSQEEWSRWAHRWLHHRPCEAPCWEGIIPGQTTVVQAMHQLQNLPIVDPASVALQQWTCGNGRPIPESRHLTWNWITGDQGGSADYSEATNQAFPSDCGDMFLAEYVPLDTEIAPQRIIRIEPSYDTPQARLPANRNRIKLTFGNVRAAFGEPSHVVVVSDDGAGWYTINIVYEQQGIVLFWTGIVASVIDDALPIQRIVFSSTPLHDAGEQFPNVAVQQWDPGRDTTAYCRRENGEPCR